MSTIAVKSIFGDLDPAKWTICLNNAPAEGGLYSYDQNPTRMKQHMGWIRGKNSGKKKFRVIDTSLCLQFIRLDKDNKFDQWLFVGAYENKGPINDADGNEIYDLVPVSDFEEYKDRLIVEYKKTQGSIQAKLRMNVFLAQNVISILERPYLETVYPFPGYSNLSIPFSELKKIVSQNIDNWRELLSNVHCVYCITDMNNGHLYIGSTYNQNGIWQRWENYVNTNGHGDNVELKKLVTGDPEYAIKYFKFTILEAFFNTRSNEAKIREREQYWGKVFLTQEFGNYNHNLYNKI